MTRLLRLAAKLYPRAWRVRYGDEFDALLDEVEPSWRNVWDTILAASRRRADRRWLAIAIVAMIAGMASFQMPRTYTRLVRIPPLSADELRLEDIQPPALASWGGVTLGRLDRALADAQQAGTLVPATLSRVRFVVLKSDPGTLRVDVIGSQDLPVGVDVALDSLVGKGARVAAPIIRTRTPWVWWMLDGAAVAWAFTRSRRLCVGLGLISAMVVVTAAMTAAQMPAFDAASIRPNVSAGADAIRGMSMQAGGRFTASNMTLKELVAFAYGEGMPMSESRIVNEGPPWSATDRFDVIAKADPSAPSSPEAVRAMLQNLLASRFHLAIRRELRESPIYALTVVKPDGALGRGLRPVSDDCSGAADPGGGRRGAPPLGRGRGFEETRPHCDVRMSAGLLTGGAITPKDVADALTPGVGRVVIDRTGFAGRFDVDLTWTPDELSNSPAVGSGDDRRGGPPPPTSNGPTLFKAVEEQLGLKLEPARGPVDVIVIERAERPSDN